MAFVTVAAGEGRDPPRIAAASAKRPNPWPPHDDPPFRERRPAHGLRSRGAHVNARQSLSISDPGVHAALLVRCVPPRTGATGRELP